MTSPELQEIEDAIAVTILLNSNNAWNESARELISRIRYASKIHIELESLVKEYFVTIQSVVQAISDIKKKTPTYEIVDNEQNGDEESNDEKE